jgi:hypothetical protein
VRAGTVPAWKYAVYLAVVAAEVAAVTLAVVFGFGVNRLFTGLLIGLVLGCPLAWFLRGLDAVELADSAIVVRRPFRLRRIGWDRVVGGRFAYDERGRWALALDLTAGEEPHQELVLLAIPPITQSVTNAYEMRKREQVTRIREVLRAHRVPVTVLPEIIAAMSEFWGMPGPRNMAQSANDPADPAEPE